MATSHEELETVSIKRTLLALFCAPLVLAVAVAPLVGYLASTRGLTGDALMSAVQPLSPVPVTIGFAFVALVTTRLARRDGLDWKDLGWTRPGARGVLIGGVAAAFLVAATTLLVYPALQAFRPGFDPAVPEIALLPAVLMLTAAAAAEDTLYRGYALRQLEARLGRPVAIAMTSAAYALLAPAQGLPLVAFAFGLGIVLCAIRVTTKSLVPVLIAHVSTALAPKLIALL